MRCLEGIRQALTKSSDLIGKYGLVHTDPEDGVKDNCMLPASRIDKLRSSFGPWLTEVKTASGGPSVLDRVRWSIRDKEKFTILLEDLRDFIDGLHNIVPAVQPRLQRLVRRGIESVKDSDALGLVVDATEKDYPGTFSRSLSSD